MEALGGELKGWHIWKWKSVLLECEIIVLDFEWFLNVGRHVWKKNMKIIIKLWMLLKLAKALVVNFWKFDLDCLI